MSNNITSIYIYILWDNMKNNGLYLHIISNAFLISGRPWACASLPTGRGSQGFWSHPARVQEIGGQIWQQRDRKGRWA